MNEDMSDIMNKIKNIIASNNTNSEGHSDSDKSSAISPENISNIISMFKSSNSDSTNSNSDNSNNNNSQIPNLDFETILKLKNIMDKMNKKDDPRSKLLLSLKPYLKESRKSKIDQYIQLLNISSAFDLFKTSGGENKK